MYQLLKKFLVSLVILFTLLLRSFHIPLAKANQEIIPSNSGLSNLITPNDVPNEIRQVLWKEIGQNPKIIFGQTYVVGVYKQQMDWGFGTIVATENNLPPDWNQSVHFLINKHETNQWIAALEGTTRYSSLLQGVPNTLVSDNKKLLLDPLNKPQVVQTPNLVGFKFPWDQTQTWEYTSSWHGSGNNGNNLDFAPVGVESNQQWFLSSASGTIDITCGNDLNDPYQAFLTVLNATLGNMGYGHLDADSLNVTDSQDVSQGCKLARAYDGTVGSGWYNIGSAWPWATCTPNNTCNWNNRTGCCELQYKTYCGVGTAAHFHWGLPNRSTTVDGWTVGTNGQWTNGTQTKSVDDSFTSTNQSNNCNGACCGCTATAVQQANNLLQPNFVDQFAAEGPAFTAVPDPQTNTTAPEAWPTLSLPTQAPAFVQNGWDAAWANKSTLTVNWSLANTDTLTGYQLFWDQSATTSGSEKPLMLSAKATGAEIPVAASGVWYVHLRAMSKDGSVSETVHAGPFNIDLTPPQMVSASLPETSWVSNPQPPTFHWPAASDEASGLGGYRVYWGDDANGQSDALVTETSYTPSETMASSSSAVRYLRVAAEDAVGNVGEWQTVAVWRYDNLPPTGTLAVGSGGEEVRSLNVTLNISGSDQQGAITDMRFSSNGTLWSAWQPYQTTQFWQLASTPEKQAVYMQLRDEAGNVSKPITAEVVAVLNADNPTSSSYELASSTFGMGGGTKSSASYTVNGTSGQTHETGSASSPSYQVNSGYWVDPDTGCTAVSAAAPLIETTVSNQVKLSWASVPNATSYNIYRSTNAPYFTPSTLYDTANTSPWYDDGAIGTPSSNYFYIIRAVGSCGESVNSQRLGKFDFAIQPGSP